MREVPGFSEPYGRGPARIFAFILIMSGVLGLRIGAVLHWPFTLDADEAVVGVMGLHILAGESLPIFYYGQSYLGTLEPFSVAAFMAVFGEHAAVLRIVPLIYFLLTLGVCGLIIRRQFQKSSINLFLLFMVAPSAFSVIWTMKARGGHIEAVFLSLLYLLLLFENRKKRQRALVWAMGFLFGFCLYINALTLPFLFLTTAIYWLESYGRPRMRWWERWPVLAFFLLGIFPLILHRILSDVPPSSPFGMICPDLRGMKSSGPASPTRNGFRAPTVPPRWRPLTLRIPLLTTLPAARMGVEARPRTDWSALLTAVNFSRIRSTRPETLSEIVSPMLRKKSLMKEAQCLGPT